MSKLKLCLFRIFLAVWKFQIRDRGTHRTQRVHIGKNILVSFQSLGGGIDPAGQNERSVDDFVSLWTSSE